MAEDLDDTAFLTYCDGMAATPRCGFVPEHVVRLLELAQAPADTIATWARQPHGVYNLDRAEVRSMVRAARSAPQRREVSP